MQSVRALVVTGVLLLPVPALAGVDSHTIYLDNCVPNGCLVHAGTTDATTDTSDIPSKSAYLSALSQTSLWPSIVSCVATTFAAFDVNITDQRPASGNYFSVMVGGLSTELAIGTGTLEVSDVPCTSLGVCSPYISKSLSFSFANDPYFANHPNAICASIASALGSTFAIDHVVDATDVMTYNAYNGIQSFHDNEACGSDCQNGQSPFGLTCAGTGGAATHACMSNNAATQNEVQMLLAVFGVSPTATITSPSEGASVAPGFGIDVTCNTQDQVSAVDVTIDSAPLATLGAAPFHAQASSSIALGPHTLGALCTMASGSTASATAHVTVVPAESADAGTDGGSSAPEAGADAGTTPTSSSSCDVTPGPTTTPSALFALAALAALAASARARRR